MLKNSLLLLPFCYKLPEKLILFLTMESHHYKILNKLNACYNIQPITKHKFVTIYGLKTNLKAVENCASEWKRLFITDHRHE